MNQIPNMITSVRLIAALLVLGICAFRYGQSCFLPLFIAAGVSDMLDGFVARRFGWASEFGARLDSVSDLSLYCAVTLFLALNASSHFTAAMPFALTGALVQAFHLLFSYWKMGSFPAYHSTFSRLSAYAIFFSVIAFWLHKPPQILAITALIWTACSLEGIAITLILPRATTNVTGIHSALKIARARR